MYTGNFKIVEGAETPKIRKSGRPPGSGQNLRFLNQMKIGDSVWDLTPKQAKNFYACAHRKGIKLSLRRLPYRTKGNQWAYMFKRIT